MHTVGLLEQALNVASQLGYQVRQEWLGGSGGGGCEIKGRRYLFLDLALSPADQLEQVLDTLYRHSEAASLAMPRELRAIVQEKKAA
ncbi:MAG: hypothetical protein HUU20_17810 [Pirellulales bacterium]|nr:hypothetical protein [Pirellulales bacterium]